MWTDIGVIVAGYLLGSIPFAYIITKLATGKDIRYEGEGNVGSRNVGHVVGRWAGILTFLLDMAKGAAACFLALYLGKLSYTIFLTGFAVMLGHGFPIWLRFIGGKGLASATGFLLPLFPLPAAIGVLLFVLIAYGLHHLNLGYTLAILGMIALAMFWRNPAPWMERLVQLAFIVLLFLISALKKIVDLPHERAVRAQSGWHEG
ncbi:MAG: glycerol-3-phosphate acyltransferase [Anaerolineae bacterium]